jgi:hypothetical protein
MVKRDTTYADRADEEIAKVLAAVESAAELDKVLRAQLASLRYARRKVRNARKELRAAGDAEETFRHQNGLLARAEKVPPQLTTIAALLRDVAARADDIAVELEDAHFEAQIASRQAAIDAGIKPDSSFKYQMPNAAMTAD